MQTLSLQLYSIITVLTLCFTIKMRRFFKSIWYTVVSLDGWVAWDTVQNKTRQVLAYLLHKSIVLVYLSHVYSCFMHC